MTFWAPEMVGSWQRRRPGTRVLRTPAYTYLISPEHNAEVFARSEEFSWWKAFGLLEPIDGRTSVILSDGEEHASRRRLMQPAFHRRRVETYVSAFVQIADDMIGAWTAGQTVDLYAEVKNALRRATLRTLFGPLATDDDMIAPAINELIAMGGTTSVMNLRRRLQTPGWRRGLAARDQLVERISAEIARVRADGPEGDSVLHDLVHGRDVDGRALTDEEIVDQVITLIIAGHETTSAALSWAVYLLLTNPDAYAAARAEVRDVLGAEAPVAADLTRLAYLGRVVQESLRVGTPVTIFPRTTVRDIDVAGDRIPADTLVILCPYLIHRDPDVWPEPLRFRPERWDPDDPAYRAPVKGAYLPFGGGSHRCTGRRWPPPRSPSSWHGCSPAPASTCRSSAYGRPGSSPPGRSP